MGFPVPKPPPPPSVDPDDTYDPYTSSRRSLFESEDEVIRWEKMSAKDQRYKLEDEWNARQDRAFYFWKVVAAIAIAAATVAVVV